jgi:hypothetical protein
LFGVRAADQVLLTTPVNITDDVKARDGSTDRSERQPYRVRLSGFISDKDIGLGDVIKRGTYTVGIKPCGGCERRAAMLNRWVTIPGWRQQ